LPREISVAPGTETSDGEVPVDAHAPHVVGDSASEWFDASYVFTPLPECLPSHWRHFRGVPHIARSESHFRESERPESRSSSHVKTLGRHYTANARRRDHRIVGGTGKLLRCNDGRFWHKAGIIRPGMSRSLVGGLADAADHQTLPLTNVPGYFQSFTSACC